MKSILNPSILNSFNSFTAYLKEHQLLFIFIAITTPVFGFNILPAFNLDILLLDDNARYYAMASDTYNFTGRSFISPYIKFIGHSIMFHSVQWARFYYVIMYMIPLSLLFYYFNRHCLKLPFLVSYGTAVIINILPNQKLIPLFIDGSSVLFGMIFVIISLIFCKKYFTDDRPFIYVTVSAAFWFVSNNTMGERAIFLLPAALIFIFFGKTTLNKKVIASAVFTYISFFRLFYYFQSTVNAAAQPVNLSFTVKVDRFLKSIWWWLPYKPATEHLKYYALFLLIIIVIGFIISTARQKREYSALKVYLFYLTWFLASAFPFWWMSKFVSTRYFYIPYMGLTLLMILSLYALLKYLFKIKEGIIAFLLVSMILGYGVSRHIVLSKMVTPYNKRNNKVLEVLKEEQLFENTQIALVNFKNGTGGFYIWSSGYLMHALRMDNITGIMGQNKNFYNPFDTDHRSYNYTMSGLDERLPLIAFRRNAEYKFIKTHLFLKWKDEGSLDSEWELLKTGNANTLELLGRGKGLESYKTFIQANNINYEDILWGDLSDEKTIKALH